MIQKLLSFFGYKEYQVEITWDVNGEKEIVCVKAWSKINAITKVAKMRDVVNPELVKKLLNKEENTTIIHDFYKKEHAHISELINKLYRHLGYRSQFDNFSGAEVILLHLSYQE